MKNINNKLQITVSQPEVTETYSLAEIKDRIRLLKDQKDVINSQLDYWQDLKQQALDLGVSEETEEVTEEILDTADISEVSAILQDEAI